MIIILHENKLMKKILDQRFPNDGVNENLEKGFRKCADDLFMKLQDLYGENILFHCFTNNSNDNKFETNELYGDSYLSKHVTNYLFKEKNFLSPFLLTEYRANIISNQNLCRVFNYLFKAIFLPDYITRYQPLSKKIPFQKNLTNKRKADIIEAIIGESARFIESQQMKETQNISETQHISEILQDLLGLIIFFGEYVFYHRVFREKKKFLPLKEAELDYFENIENQTNTNDNLTLKVKRDDDQDLDPHNDSDGAKKSNSHASEEEVYAFLLKKYDCNIINEYQ